MCELTAPFFEPDQVVNGRDVGKQKHLPHEISNVTWRNVSLSRSIESLEGCIGLKRLRLAQVLAAKLYSLLGLTRVSKKLGQFFLCLNRHVMSLHG